MSWWGEASATVDAAMLSGRSASTTRSTRLSARLGAWIGSRAREFASNAGSAHRWIIGSALLLMLLSGMLACQARRVDFDVDLPPPTGHETYAEVLPAQIGGSDAAIEDLQLLGGRLRGVRASYGSRAVIEIMQSPVAADLDVYATGPMRERLASFGTASGGKTGGRWLLSVAGNGGQALAWQNRDWLFLLAGSDQAAFDEAIDKFAYIRRH